MPTTPQTAPEMQSKLPVAERIERSWNIVQNVGAFNPTSHPAVSIPCATVMGFRPELCSSVRVATTRQFSL